MEKQLNISTTLSLPPDVVTQRDAILAVSGAGKSNAARAMAEEFFAAKLPFVAIDPKGDWWGLRSGRDGSAKGGLDVVIFGGSHGDVPLERTGGAYVAELVSRERLSSILDLSGFESKAAMKAFLHDFGRRLYQKNQDPLKLFCDEVDEYIPQKPMKDELRLLSVYEDIVRRGRTKGLGITLITQRSAIVSKNVLTQVETLYAMRTTGPQDVKVVEAWMQYHGADRQMLATLATLADGEAWVWSPHYLKKMERFRFRLSHTFDSGATPTNHRTGSRRRAATLSDVDVASIAAKMTETIARAVADDPRELQKKISSLTKALAAEEQRRIAAEKKAEKAAANGGSVSEDEIRPWREWVGRARAELEIEQRRSEALLMRVRDVEAHLVKLEEAAMNLSLRLSVRLPPFELPKTNSAELDALALAKTPGESARKRVESRDVPIEIRRQGATVQASPTWNGASNGAGHAIVPSSVPSEVRGPKSGVPGDFRVDRGGKSEVSAGELRVIGALLHRGPLTKTRLAILTGYQHSAGGFATTMASVRARGWVGSTGEGTFRLGEEGKARAASATPPPTGAELVALWEGKLGKPARAMFAILLEETGPITQEELAVRAGYKSGSGGNVAEAVAELRRYALVEGTAKALHLGEAREDFA